MSGGVETLEAAYYWYDGDGRGLYTPEPRSGERGNMVKSVLNEVVTYYVGAHYEKKVQSSQKNERKYYFADTSRIAMLAPQGCSASPRKNGILTWLLSDHLGSTSVTADASGSLVSSLRYTTSGEVRAASGTTSTEYRYTGQREEAEIGLYFYVARFYDPALGRFVQADSIVPDQSDPSDWDRYNYSRNNPVRYNDPSGHIPACEENCKEQRRLEKLYDKLGAVNYFKHEIKNQFGIKMVDSGVKWAVDNLMTAYHALSLINTKLNSHLKSMVSGTTFTLSGGGNQYYGRTFADRVEYHVFDGNTKLPLINFLHETTHLLDFVPATYNVFSDPLRSETPTWVKDGYVDRDLLGDKFNQPVQSIPMNEPNDPNEYWADAFANYVAGNINLAEPTGKGQNMYDYVFGVLNPYANP